MLQHFIFWILAYWLNEILGGASGNGQGHKHQRETVAENNCNVSRFTECKVILF